MISDEFKGEERLTTGVPSELTFRPYYPNLETMLDLEERSI